MTPKIRGGGGIPHFLPKIGGGAHPGSLDDVNNYPGEVGGDGGGSAIGSGAPTRPASLPGPGVGVDPRIGAGTEHACLRINDDAGI